MTKLLLLLCAFLPTLNGCAMSYDDDEELLAAEEGRPTGARYQRDRWGMPAWAPNENPARPVSEPWLMWGGDATITLNGVPLVSSISESQQLVRTSYNRPDTFTFLFGAQIGQSASPIPVAVRVEFDVLIGLGRTSVTIPSFAVVEFSASEASTPGTFKWVQEVEAPPNTAGRVSPNLVSKIPAQVLNVSAVVASTGSINAGNTLDVTPFAFVSPFTHVRPDWYQEHFASELGGR
jgi:hypothetical protein